MYVTLSIAFRSRDRGYLKPGTTICYYCGSFTRLDAQFW